MKGQQAIGTLIIFIALVITAAVATYIIMAATNQAGAKASGVSGQTVNTLTTGFTAIAVQGYAPADDEINTIGVKVKLAPGSSTIDLNDAKIQWQANGGQVYKVYSYGGLNSTATGLADFTPANADDYYVLTNQSVIIGTADKYLDQGEAYYLAFVLPTALGKGQDWHITITTPYTTPLKLAGVAPDVIKGGTIIDLQ